MVEEMRKRKYFREGINCDFCCTLDVKPPKEREDEESKYTDMTELSISTADGKYSLQFSVHSADHEVDRNF